MKIRFSIAGRLLFLLLFTVTALSAADGIGRVRYPAVRSASTAGPYLYHFDDEIAEYYIDRGQAGDKIAVWFQSPAAGCYLSALEFCFYAPPGGGTLDIEVRKVAASAKPQLTGSDTIADGEMFGDAIIGSVITQEFAGSGQWERIDLSVINQVIDVGREAFWVVLTKRGRAPVLLADDGNANPQHSWGYFPSEGETQDWERLGKSAGLEALIRCAVVYYEDPPPAVIATQTNDTYATGSILLEAVATDYALDSLQSGVTGASLLYSINGAPFDTVVAEVTENPDRTFSLSAAIPPGIPGDEIEYYFEAVDRMGSVSAENTVLLFRRLEPENPFADLLLIADNPEHQQRGLGLYRRILDEAGLVYEFWDVEEHNGIDESVIQFGAKNIIVCGSGTRTVPLPESDTDPGYGRFLRNGGDLALIDPDWFYSHKLGETPEFGVGDFAYDYFGIAAGSSDPQPVDTIFYGLNETPVDKDFTAALGGYTIRPRLNPAAYWSDYFVIGDDATAIFQGSEDRQIYGCTKETSTYRTLYLGFAPQAGIEISAAGDTSYTKFGKLVRGIVRYFEISTPPLIDEVQGPGPYILAGPFGVQARIRDADGDAVSAVVRYSSNGQNWLSVGMTAEGQIYRAGIPEIAGADTFYWSIEARAAGDISFYPPRGRKPKVFYRYVATSDILVFMNTAAEKDAILKKFFGVGDFENEHTAYFHYDVWDTALTAELLSLYKTVYEIATGGPLFDNRANVRDWLKTGAKNYFLCGDEWLGKLSGWQNREYAYGDFEFDILGIGRIWNDVSAYYQGGAGTASPLAPVYNNAVTGALYNRITAAADTLKYNPATLTGRDNWLDGFQPLAESRTRVCMTTDTLAAAPPLAVGVTRTLNDDKVVFLAFDPLAIGSVSGTWWGFSQESPQTQSLDWFEIAYTVDVRDEGLTGLPADYRLDQNFPNPFNAATRILYALPHESRVKIAVFDVRGAVVTVLQDGRQSTGNYQLDWDGRNMSGKTMSNGVYFYRLQTDDYDKVRKMLLLK